MEKKCSMLMCNLGYEPFSGNYRAGNYKLFLWKIRSLKNIIYPARLVFFDCPINLTVSISLFKTLQPLKNIYLFIWKAELKREKQRDPPSANGLGGQGWARWKPGTSNYIWISHVGCMVQTLGPSSSAFPVALAGS